jgi:hypothetical protein
MVGKDKGNILLNPEWKNTKEVFGDINEFCKNAITGEYIEVEASGGKVIGKATILERKVSQTEWEITVIIPKKCLEGKNVVMEFGSGKCGNSLVTEEFYIAKVERPSGYVPMPYAIDPSFTNNNPVVPYWGGVPYYGGWGCYGGGWGDYYYPFVDGDGGDKPNPPAVPIPSSGLLSLSVGIYFIIKNKKWFQN